MTDPISLPFEMNQGQLTEAIAAAMPSLIAELAVEFTNGRPPKGLTAQVVVSEAQIREAVIAHARRLVNPQFRHFSISFKATRGEDGMTTSIIASTHPIAFSEAPVADASATAAAEPKASPLKADPEPAPVAADPEPTPVDPTPVAEPVEEVATADVAVDTVEDEKAPWTESEDATVAAPVTETTDTKAAEVEEALKADAAAATDEAEKPAPAAGRSRLFADLQRPKND